MPESPEQLQLRVALVSAINSRAAEREKLEAQYGQVWDTQELQQDFEVLSFLAPLVRVRRKSDGVGGTLAFQHAPRYYFQFDPA
jgi:hypothetical protein